MTDLDLSEDTDKIIELLLRLVEIAQHHFKRTYFLEDNKNEITTKDKKVIDDELEEINKFLIPATTYVHEYLVKLENSFGGGWTNLGAPRLLKLISEGDASIETFNGFINGYETIIHKLVLLDCHKSGQAALACTDKIYAKFSIEKKVKVA